jgi:VWFA-related protein
MRRHPLPLSRRLLPALAALLLAGAAGAQEPGVPQPTEPGGQPPLFVERLDVNVVNVEVFVTDGQGRRVTGLEKEDFEILQDGKPIEISNFFFVSQPNRVDVELGRAAAAGDPVMTPPSELPEEQQLNLLVYVDHFNLHPQNRKRALEELRGFLEDRMFQGDRVMLMGYDGQLDVTQPFTRDWNQVREGLHALGRVKAMRPQDDAERRRVLSSMQLAEAEGDPVLAEEFVRSYIQQQISELRRSAAALEGTVRAMAGLPGRKALLYVSDGLPQRPGEELYQYLADIFAGQVDTTGGLLTAESTHSDAAQASITEDQSRLFDRITRAANANQVTFYTVDARGGAGERLFGADSDSVSIAGGGRVALEAMRTINMQEPLIEMAAATGGASILNTFELADAFYRTGVDFDNFYSLGFRSPAQGDGGFHDIQVRVKRPGMKVRHRQGFIDKPQEERVADRTLSSLIFKMESNPLGIDVDFGRPERQGRRAYEVPVLVRIPFRDITLLPNGRMQEGRLRIYLVVEDEKGGVSELHEFPYPVQVPADQIAEVRGKDIGFGRVLRLAPGTPRVAVGVWDELSGTESFVHKQVRVSERPGGSAR